MRIPELYNKFLESAGISTDTRNIAPGSMFFALRGDRFNANEFAAEALTKGASYAVVDQAEYAKGESYILVSNTLESLQQLARFHRDRLEIPVLALTGSNGKTTTKELIHAVLSRRYRVHATRGNLNNHIGVPLTVLGIKPHHEIAVVEMGANHVGEIAMLCGIADPTHGLITNIGRAHIGLFGGVAQIARAKGELYDHLAARNGVVFINSRNELLTGMAKKFKATLTYPAKGDYYTAQLIAADPYVRLVADNGQEVTTQLIGAYNFENIASALCIGKYFGVAQEEANAAVAAYRPENMRSQVVRKGSNTIILDAYNANPSSMQAAIENLLAMPANRKVLILGDMFELGDESDREHRLLASLIKQHGFKDVYLCGNLMAAAAEELPEAKHFTNKADLIEALKSADISDSLVLIKASRGIGLEEVVEYIGQTS
ncbi:MAG TPA: UDP-N-acetylmuramoyl-tripeptide--D-alanyl-D-alanine ligase [Cyclobacteriaceae bacterium]|jgi:UDP-N-acetylmuramoyl-tripeptide--D-alanyl-D-alanine ligase